MRLLVALVLLLALPSTAAAKEDIHARGKRWRAVFLDVRLPRVPEPNRGPAVAVVFEDGRPNQGYPPEVVGTRSIWSGFFFIMNRRAWVLPAPGDELAAG